MTIRCCSCNKFLGIKKLFKKGISHGYCPKCYETAIFSIKGFLFKYLTYKGYEVRSRWNRSPNRIVERLKGAVGAVSMIVLWYVITVICFCL